MLNPKYPILMKKAFLLTVILSGLLFTDTFAQDPGYWLYRLQFDRTGNCIDSVTCFIAVNVQVNLEAVPDSAYINFIIGDSIGADNIYNKEFLNVPSIRSLPDVRPDTTGNVIINLGEYLRTDFFVDMMIREQEISAE
jgi:hypothetical protein